MINKIKHLFQVHAKYNQALTLVAELRIYKGLADHLIHKYEERHKAQEKQVIALEKQIAALQGQIRVLEEAIK